MYVFPLLLSCLYFFLSRFPVSLSSFNVFSLSLSSLTFLSLLLSSLTFLSLLLSSLTFLSHFPFYIFPVSLSSLSLSSLSLSSCSLCLTCLVPRCRRWRGACLVWVAGVWWGTTWPRLGSATCSQQSRGSPAEDDGPRTWPAAKKGAL